MVGSTASALLCRYDLVGSNSQFVPIVREISSSRSSRLTTAAQRFDDGLPDTSQQDLDRKVAKNIVGKFLNASGRHILLVGLLA